MTPALRELVGTGLRVAGVAVVAVLVGLFVGAEPQPVGLVAVVVGVAVAWWLAGLPAADAMAWPKPPLPPGTLTARADPATDAWTHRLAGARPGRGFSTRRLAETLADIAEAKLMRRPGVDPDAVWASASDHLSPELARYLGLLADPEAVPPPLPRRTLRAHLAELEDL